MDLSGILIRKMLPVGKNRNYPVVLLAVAIALLAIGLALRPHEEAKLPEIDMAQLQQLERMAGQRRLRDLSSYLSTAANGVAGSIMYLDSAGRSGLVWDSARVIAPARERGRPQTATAPDGNRVTLEPRRSADAVPFAAWAAPSGGAGMKPPSRTGRPNLGDWVLAVAKNSRNQVVFSQGLYQGRAEARCGSFPYETVQSSAPLSAALVGGGLFTLDGGLLGFVGECGGVPVAISAATVDAFLKKPQTLNDRLEAAFGMRIAESPAGVQVVTVWAGSAAGAAGVKPGDLVQKADGGDVHSGADLEALAGAPAASHTLELRRNRRKLNATLAPVQESGPATAAAPFGLTLGAGERDVTVVAVEPGSPAQRAGIREGDLLRRIGTRPAADYAAAGRMLAGLGGRSVVLTLERNRRELEVLITP
jgi:S1-C subfamily serine protease